ncbi:MAG TPA: hypothetical protein VFD32_20935, partial [Dehalococcoidia bacterium]|nr:hypothetical protein [Dehalococcoidia bacterium]
MTAEPPVYARELRWLLEQSAGCLCALSAAELRWQPPLPAANSPAAIATHLLGATRVYALGFGCGLPVERDRPAEFAPGEGAIGELAAALRGLA